MKTSSFIIVILLCFRIENVIAHTFSFDASLLNHGSGGIDLTLLEKGGQLPGIYPVDIILNGSRIDSRDIFFYTKKNRHGEYYLKPCLTRGILINYGLKIEKYPNLFRQNSEKNRDSSDCADLSVIPQATEDYHFIKQQLILGIPQVAIRPPLTGIAHETMWDDGISAFLLNWQVEGSHWEYRSNTRNSSDNFWASLEPGINLGSWRIRNLTTWNKSSGQSGKWESSYIRVERGLNNIKSRLTFGDDYTPSDIFDSVPFRGGMLGSDENMVPYNQREFAPVVRGIARTQARIEVRQNGYLIQSRIVSPGAFALTDLPVTGNGGDLQVWVLESDGTIQTFNVPFTTPAIALREGYLKYNVTVGEYRPSDDSIEGAYLGQLTAMYGLPWSLTAFGGIQVSEHYQGNALGLGLSLGGFGSISLDTIYSRGQQKGYSNEIGKTWRVRYDKSFELTGTSFAAGYQDSSAGYHSLADVLDTYRNGTAYRSYDNRIRRTTINISQALGEWGSVALNGGRDEYRDKVKQDYIGASYSNSWKGITFAVNWSRNNNIGDYYSNSLRTENNLNLWMSIPMKRWLGGDDKGVTATAQIQRITGQNTLYETGLNGRAFGQKLYWDIREQIVPGSKYDADTSLLNLRWSGGYGELTGMYSYNRNTRQMNVGTSGSMAIHSGGIAFGQKTDDTMALIAAPGIAGASVGGWPGVSTDFRGYTLVGHVSPYQENIITLDPTTFPDNTEVSQTDRRVIPTKGALVQAEFKTRVGNRALVTLTRKDGTLLPFGTVVTLERKTGEAFESAGVVDDKGKVYLSGLSEAGKLKAQWGTNSQCYADYKLPLKKGMSGIFLTRAVCM